MEDKITNNSWFRVGVFFIIATLCFAGCAGMKKTYEDDPVGTIKKGVEIGMSVLEVIQILGQPFANSVAHSFKDAYGNNGVESRQYMYYADMRICLRNGKVVGVYKLQKIK